MFLGLLGCSRQCACGGLETAGVDDEATRRHAIPRTSRTALRMSKNDEKSSSSPSSGSDWFREMQLGGSGGEIPNAWRVQNACGLTKVIAYWLDFGQLTGDQVHVMC